MERFWNTINVGLIIESNFSVEINDGKIVNVVYGEK